MEKWRSVREKSGRLGAPGPGPGLPVSFCRLRVGPGLGSALVLRGEGQAGARVSLVAIEPESSGSCAGVREAQM